MYIERFCSHCRKRTSHSVFKIRPSKQWSEQKPRAIWSCKCNSCSQIIELNGVTKRTLRIITQGRTISSQASEDEGSTTSRKT